MAEENASPISAAEPPVTNPMASATSVHASTLKLKPVIRKPTIGGATSLRGPGATTLSRPTVAKPAAAQPAAAAPSAAPVDKLKNATQKLKGVTQQIPAQAILHKTGIIADQDLTEAQKQASKSRTARISLSDAIGAAPVSNEAAPMKTIRIKRPVDIQNPSSSSLKPQPAPAAAAPSEPAPAPAEAPAPSATITQRKTLKIARPGSGTVRPTGKFGVKKPGSATLAKPTETAAEEPSVGDIPEVKDMEAASAKVRDRFATPAQIPADRIPDVGKAWQVINLIVQIAACVVIGFLGWTFYQDVQNIFKF